MLRNESRKQPNLHLLHYFSCVTPLPIAFMGKSYINFIPQSNQELYMNEKECRDVRWNVPTENIKQEFVGNICRNIAVFSGGEVHE